MTQEHGNKHMTEEMTGYEYCSNFILPQLRVSTDHLTKTEGKDIFPFEVIFKKSKNRIKDDNFCSSPPSIIRSLSLKSSDDNEESIPEELRYIRDVFNGFQGFVENIG